MTTGAYESDVRTLTRYQAYCSCGWKGARWSDQTSADLDADRHDETHQKAEEDDRG